LGVTLIGLIRHQRWHVRCSAFRGAADHVDKILRGTKPGEIPVEQPTKFDLVLNLTTAKALDLAIPDRFCCAPTR